MALHVIDYHVRFGVIDLDAVLIVAEEVLVRLVDRESDMFPRRMPVGVDKGTDGGIGLGVQFLDLVIQDHRCPAELGSRMEKHSGGIPLAIGVTVDAVASGQ